MKNKILELYELVQYSDSIKERDEAKEKIENIVRIYLKNVSDLCDGLEEYYNSLNMEYNFSYVLYQIIRKCYGIYERPYENLENYNFDIVTYNVLVVNYCDKWNGEIIESLQIPLDNITVLHVDVELVGLKHLLLFDLKKETEREKKLAEEKIKKFEKILKTVKDEQGRN